MSEHSSFAMNYTVRWQLRGAAMVLARSIICQLRVPTDIGIDEMRRISCEGVSCIHSLSTGMNKGGLNGLLELDRRNESPRIPLMEPLRRHLYD